MTQVDIPLIDCHTHIGRLPGVVGEVFYPQDLLYIAAREGARFMLVSSATATTVGQHAGTDEVLAMVARYGDRLGGMLWINPHDPTWESDVDRAAQAGFYGIKIHPTLDHYAVDRDALDAVFAVAREHRWPILTHADNDGTPMSALKYEPLIQAYPDVVLILAHLRLEAIPLAKRYENVFVDITYVDPMRVELGVDALGPSKILFGSDACEGFDVGHPVARARPPRSYAGLLEGLRVRGIADAVLEQICYRNAQQLFQLAP
ncbi:MAG: amidohydrolase family protein [Chloroflexi bacterium]|nr:amidohydrolase family protein [Chloroflexota bacterium]